MLLLLLYLCSFSISAAEIIDLGSSQNDGQYLSQQKDLGFWLPSNSKFTHLWNGANIPNYSYTWLTDKHRRRITPSNELKKYSKNILFFGCSFTFGSGLNQNETLPYFYGENQGEYRPYNYGVGATGPHQYLRYLELYGDIISQQVDHSSGQVVYIAIEDHFNRAYGSMNKFWLLDSPYYSKSSDSKLIFKGTFRKDRPITTYIYSLINKIDYIKRKGIDYPKVSDDQYNLFCSIVREMKNQINTKLKGYKFIVVNHPLSPIRKKYLKCIKEHATLINFTTEELHNSIPEYSKNNLYRFPDGHPKASFNNYFSKILYNKLK